MRTIKTCKTLVIAALCIGFTSCDNDDDKPQPDPVQSEQVINLAAAQTGGQGQPVGGAFAKFDFQTGMEATSDTEWDIAFRGTTIAVNGGVVTGTADEPTRNGNVGATIVSGTFASVITADGLTFTQDADASFAVPTGSDNGWYNYNQPTNIVTPIPGKVLVFRTRDGNYAKVEILSYYLDNPIPIVGGFGPGASASRYYTFNYVYNPNEGETSFE
jgi:hypothetical protein